MSEEREPRRIVVAVASAAHARTAIDAAADLARRLRVELTALFVEDEELMRVAGLPFALEIGADAEARALDAERLERRFRSTAREVRAVCAQAEARCRVRIHVETARGMVARELAAASEGAEMVVLGRGAERSLTSAALAAPETRRRGARLGRTARSVISSSRGTVAVVASVPSIERPVAVLFDGSDSSRRALELAVRLAGEDHHNLVVLIAGRAPDLEAEARAAASGRGIVPRCVEVAASPSAIMEALAAQRCRAFVVGRTSVPVDEEGLMGLVAGLDLSVFVVG